MAKKENINPIKLYLLKFNDNPSGFYFQFFLVKLIIFNFIYINSVYAQIAIINQHGGKKPLKTWISNHISKLAEKRKH